MQEKTIVLSVEQVQVARDFARRIGLTPEFLVAPNQEGMLEDVLFADAVLAIQRAMLRFPEQ